LARVRSGQLREWKGFEYNQTFFGKDPSLSSGAGRARPTVATGKSAMRDVYACSFQLDVGPAALDGAYESAIASSLGWAFDHYVGVAHPDEAQAGRWEHDVDYVDWRTLAVPGVDDRLWTLVYFQRDRFDSSLGWRTTEQLALEPPELRMTLRLAIEPIEMRVLPAKFEVRPPRIVSTLAGQLSGKIDGQILSSHPTAVGIDNVTDLVDLLTSRTRRLPVVVITPSPRFGRPLIDERRAADRLFGIAHVVWLRTGQVSWGLTDQLGGNQLSVFGGAVRIYWPGFDRDSDPFDHRRWLPERIEEFEAAGRPLVDQLARLVSSVAVLRVPADGLARRLRSLADSDARRELADLRRRIAEAPEKFTDELWADYERLSDTELNQRERIDALEDEIAAIRQNYASLARDYGVVSSTSAGDLEEEIEVTTPREAVDAVAASYSDVLVFLPEALESADACTYPNVEKLYAALRTIGDVARGWRAGRLDAGFPGAFKDAGVEFGPGVSSLTVGRTGSQYLRQYQGHEISLGPHVKLGKGTSAALLARVYWWVDEEAKQFVIGHVGRHLKDGTT
jgi:hypothetical protein